MRNSETALFAPRMETSTGKTLFPVYERSARGGGGTLVLFVVRGRAIFRGTFFKPLRNYGYHFHNFLTIHGIMGVLFRGFFIISGIMTQVFIRFVELWS